MIGPRLPGAFRMGRSLTCPACYAHPDTTDEEREEMAEIEVRECGVDGDRCGYCDAVIDVPRDCGHYCTCAAEAHNEWLAAKGDYLYDLWKDEGRYG